MTATVLANFLMFALFAAGLFFAYRLVRKEVREYIRINNRQNRKLIAKTKADVGQFEARIKYLEMHQHKRIPEGTFEFNPFKASEDRHVAKLKQVVEVNGETVVAG